MTRIFISYSHDSTEHSERVLEFAQRLRATGVDAWIDQFEQGTPVNGWPRWMLDQLDIATFVLVICTETYYRRFRGHEQPGIGKGVDWEGALITLELYDARSRSVKFVPVLFDPEFVGFVPEPLRGNTRYVLDSDDSFSRLLDFLAGVAGVEPLPLAEPPVRVRRTTDPTELVAASPWFGAAPAVTERPVEPVRPGRPDAAEQDEPPAHPFTIRIGPAADGRHSLSLIESPVGPSGPEPIELDTGSLDRLLWTEATQVRGSVRRANSQGVDNLLPSSAAAKRVGSELYRSLSNSHVWGALQESMGMLRTASDERLQVLIDTSDAPELALIPWELLYDAANDSFVFSDQFWPLARSLDVGPTSSWQPVAPPLRLLLAIAAPTDEPELMVGDEIRELDAALQPLVDSQLLEITRVDHTTSRALYEALLDTEPHIFHFVGHGGVAADGGYILLEPKRSGDPAHEVTASQLGAMLRHHRDSLRLVFLNSCLGAAPGHDKALGGVAHALVRSGIPAVIAMQFPIPDAAAIDLAWGFYRALASGRPVDGALAMTRTYMNADGYEVEWAAPALFTRPGVGRLFDLSSSTARATTSTSEASGSQIGGGSGSYMGGGSLLDDPGSQIGGGSGSYMGGGSLLDESDSEPSVESEPEIDEQQGGAGFAAPDGSPSGPADLHPSGVAVGAPPAARRRRIVPYLLGAAAAVVLVLIAGGVFVMRDSGDSSQADARAAQSRVVIIASSESLEVGDLASALEYSRRQAQRYPDNEAIADWVAALESLDTADESVVAGDYQTARTALSSVLVRNILIDYPGVGADLVAAYETAVEAALVDGDVAVARVLIDDVEVLGLVTDALADRGLALESLVAAERSVVSGEFAVARELLTGVAVRDVLAGYPAAGADLVVAYETAVEAALVDGDLAVADVLIDDVEVLGLATEALADRGLAVASLVAALDALANDEHDEARELLARAPVKAVLDDHPVLLEPVIGAYELAISRQRTAGEIEQALRLVRDVLDLDPANPGALVLEQELEDELEVEVLPAQPGALFQPRSVVMVEPGDTLWSIATESYGEPLSWSLIVHANRATITDRDVLSPGQRLVIPVAEPLPEGFHLVRPGDSLSSIAGEMYGDPTRWPDLWAANSVLIDDPDQIAAGMVIAVP